MSLASRLLAFVQAVGADIKALQANQALSGNVPRARAYVNGSGSHTNNGNWQKVPLNAVSSNSDTMWDAANSRLVFRRAGTFDLAGLVVFGANGTGLRFAEIRYTPIATGVAVSRGVSDHNPPSGSDVNTMACEGGPQDVQIGDYIELWAYQSSGGNLGYSLGEHNSYLSAVMINGYGPKGDAGDVANIPYEVSGNVNSDGTIREGTGFSVVRNSAGRYTITFNVPFTARPAITVSNNAGSARLIETGAPTLNSVQIIVSNSDTPWAAVDNAFTFIAKATDGQMVLAQAPSFTPLIVADTSGAPDDTEKVSWRSVGGALVAEVRAWTDSAGELAQAELRALSSSTKKAETQVYSGNGSTRSRLRNTNNPALSTRKREIALEMHDDSGSVILTKALMRSDGSSDYLTDATAFVADTDWVACSFVNGVTNYGSNWVPLSWRYLSPKAIHLLGMVVLPTGLVAGSQIAGNLPSTLYNQMCPSWANGISGAQVVRFDVNRLSGGLYLAQSSYGANWHWFDSVLRVT